MTDELPSDPSRMFRTPREVLDAGVSSSDPRVMDAMAEVNRRMMDTLVQALGISQELLTAEIPYCSRIEHEIRRREYEARTKPFMEAAKRVQEAMPKMEMWQPVGYFVLYLRRRPHVLMYGSGTYGYVESLSKSFSSTRRARAWARRQMECFLHMCLCPGWVPCDPDYEDPYHSLPSFKMVEPRFEIHDGFTGFSRRASVIAPTQL